ncbi:MAG: hypothetical protein LBR51_02215 [Bacteroidales bacterium]|jgi:hypothetical protein|nr:hypothetical protein [Bacteroidales bacterium]
MENPDYNSDAPVYAGLANALQENIRLQAEYDFVATDVKVYNKNNFAIQFLPSYSNFVEDGNKLFPLAQSPSIAAFFCFEKTSRELEIFKQTEIFRQFTDISRRCSSDELAIFAIDFGQDALGAAQIFTDIMISVYGCTGHETCECKTWKEGERRQTAAVTTQPANFAQPVVPTVTPAKTGFILGLLSVLFVAWIPFIGLPLPICGLVFSNKELKKTPNNLSRAGKIMSIIGIAIGALMFLLTIIGIAAEE